MALTKEKIAGSVQRQINLLPKQSAEIIETLLELMKKTMESGEDILISSFGKFCVREKGERKGRNPATGDDMMLGKRRVVTIRCANRLRKRINL